MKTWQKWTAGGLILAMFAAGLLRTLTPQKNRQAALQQQQIGQKTEVSVDLTDADLVRVKQLDLTRTVQISGPLTAVNTALVKARVPGELQGLTVREGDAVKAGQVRARIDPTESQARLRQAHQQAQAAKAQVDIARRNLENNRALVTQGFISSTALQSSQAGLDTAQANFAAAQASVDLATKGLEDAVLRAPISGQVAQRLAQPGERVAVETRVLEIVDNRQLELQASLSAADSLQVKIGQPAKLRIEGTEQMLQARVARINPSATSGNRAVLIYLSITPEAGLRQGLFAEGSLFTGSLSALAVPLSAVRTDKPQPYVQLLKEGRVFHQSVATSVRSVRDEETYVAISNVPEGALLVAGTVGALRPGTRVHTIGSDKE